MARGLLPEAVTVEDLIAACGGAIPPEMEPKDWDGAPLDAGEAQARPKRPLWKRITAGLSLLGAVGLRIFRLRRGFVLRLDCKVPFFVHSSPLRVLAVFHQTVFDLDSFQLFQHRFRTEPQKQRRRRAAHQIPRDAREIIA